MRVELRGTTEVWTFDRPSAHNALDHATFDALDAALARISSDPSVRALVIAADGPTFVAGGDLRELRSASTLGDALRVAERGRRVCDGLALLSVPVLAAVNGPAIGGGAELALACDLRIASPAASLCFKHAAMGVTTAWGVLPRLLSIAGHAATSRMLLTARAVDATEGHRLGLFDAVAPGDEGACVSMALQWAGDIAGAAPGAVAGMKRLLREASSGDALRASERSLFLSTWTSADHGEAVEAFFDKRPPRWTGR